MKRLSFIIPILVIILITTIFSFGCSAKKTMQASTDVPQHQLNMSIDDSGGDRSIPQPAFNELVATYGTTTSQNQPDTLHTTTGTWGNNPHFQASLGAGIYDLGVRFKHANYWYKLFPNITASNGVNSYTLLCFKVKKFITGTDTMFTDVTTEYETRVNDNGLYIYESSHQPVNPVVATISYTGIADPALSWPAGTNFENIKEMGRIVTPGEPLYIILTYNKLESKYKLPMVYNTSTQTYSFDFPYPPDGGLNWRIEKADGNMMVMGIRLTTSLGSISCHNVRFLNGWALMQGGLSASRPYQPYAGQNNLLDFLWDFGIH